MKPLYPFCRFVLPIILLFCCQTKSLAQCVHGTPGNTAYDTTINFASGVTSLTLKFPKFDPTGGMVTCMRLCTSITAVVDSLSFENNDLSAGNTYTASYVRTDIMTGPGLVSPIFNNISKNYSFPLSASDGVPGSGPDFGKVVKDTISNAVARCVTLNDSVSLVPFYGLDSLEYTYTISGGVSIGSSPNAAIGIATSGFMQIHFEYCTCPPLVLPLNLKIFNVNKLSDYKAELKWSGYDDPDAQYHYEAEVSRDGRNFSSIGTMPKSTSSSATYMMSYSASNNEAGLYFFRIKQVYAHGYVRYSNIKQVRLGSSGATKFSIYPNPSTGIVGIKFDNNYDGQFNIQIFNTQGQLVVKKDVVITGASQIQVATLTSGVYWVRLTDKQSQETSVTQLLIK